MPDIEFTLEDRADADAVWICGYEPGSQAVVNELRVQHPHAVLVVTGREPIELWESEVLSAGADCVSSWPLQYAQLNQMLHRRAAERRT